MSQRSRVHIEGAEVLFAVVFVTGSWRIIDAYAGASGDDGRGISASRCPASHRRASGGPLQLDRRVTLAQRSGMTGICMGRRRRRCSLTSARGR